MRRSFSSAGLLTGNWCFVTCYPGRSILQPVANASWRVRAFEGFEQDCHFICLIHCNYHITTFGSVQRYMPCIAREIPHNSIFKSTCLNDDLLSYLRMLCFNIQAYTLWVQCWEKAVLSMVLTDAASPNDSAVERVQPVPLQKFQSTWLCLYPAPAQSHCIFNPSATLLCHPTRDKWSSEKFSLLDSLSPLGLLSSLSYDFKSLLLVACPMVHQC